MMTRVKHLTVLSILSLVCVAGCDDGSSSGPPDTGTAAGDVGDGTAQPDDGSGEPDAGSEDQTSAPDGASPDGAADSVGDMESTDTTSMADVRPDLAADLDVAEDTSAPDLQATDTSSADTQTNTDMGMGGDGDMTTMPPMGTCGGVARADITGAVQVADDAALRTALANGGTVELTADIVATGPFTISVPTVFDGGGHTIDGNQSTHLFVVERTDATIQNVTLRDGNNQVADSEHFSRRSGAAIMATGSAGPGIARVGSLTVIDVHFIDNVIKASGPGDLRGGALYSFALPDTTISGATFTGNVGSNGGAIGGLGSSFTIIDTLFENNSTNGLGAGGTLEGHGGAISLDALSQNGVTAYLDICGSTFRNNTATNGGGAIYLVSHWQTGSAVTIDRTLFEGNTNTSTSEGQGGAIFLMDDNGHAVPANPVDNSASITNSAFVSNEIWGSGGGVWYWTEDGRLHLENTTFSDNRVTRDTTGMGGGLAASRGPVDIVNCSFADNWAKFHGGGIQAGGNATISLQNTLFYNNTSDRDGGWANFHTNREVDSDLGGNMQYLDPTLIIDSNSDALVSANAARGVDLLVEALADNGGPTPTHALLTGSPAIDAGVSSGAPSEDQRGEARDSSPDVGAYEAPP